MLRKTCLLLVLLFFAVTSVWAIEIGGVEFSDTVKLENNDLVLNGVGLRRKFGIKIYAVGLYLKAKTTDNMAVVNADEPMRLEMRWRIGSPPSKIDETYYESFAKSVGAAEAKSYGPDSDYGPMSKDIVTFMGWLNTRKTTKKDVWAYNYIPGKGTEVHVFDGTKDEVKGVIPGLDFKVALFKIWLSDDPPVGKSLMEDLMGK